MKFRKLPVTIDAFKWFPGVCFPEPAFDLLHDKAWVMGDDSSPPGEHYLQIMTLEGMMRAQPGDYIIRGVKGEFYPCKPDIFEMSYETFEARELPRVIRARKKLSPEQAHAEMGEDESSQDKMSLKCAMNIVAKYFSTMKIDK